MTTVSPVLALYLAAAGSVQTGSEQVRLTVSGEFDSVDTIRAIGIRAGQRTFRLGDIAEIRLEKAFHEIHRDIWASLRVEVQKAYAMGDGRELVEGATP